MVKKWSILSISYLDISKASSNHGGRNCQFFPFDTLIIQNFLQPRGRNDQFSPFHILMFQNFLSLHVDMFEKYLNKNNELVSS